ncbi:DUF4865 family protein [Catenuloplanes japonicus]|uniref:DUF4865 family protein n=1 Tax=Catenuloplanes japonicus TaxID=33876 RepID=UPI0005260A8C|nr:DUF4865 family protein [Catenuloplanes japonicus]
MIALHYQLNLPSDYDVSPLRARIPEIGKRFDRLPGLGVKAFLLRDLGGGAAQYAPFYLWTDPAAAARFLWDDNGSGLGGVIGKYGRPVVQTWIGGGYRRGAAFGGTVTHAVRRVGPVAGEPSEVAAATRDALATGEPGVHSAAWGIDPRTWELMTFTLHTHRPDADGGELYEVPHLSAPHEADL